KIKKLYLKVTHAKSFVEHHDNPAINNLLYLMQNDLQFVTLLDLQLAHKTLSVLDGSMQWNADLKHEYIPFFSLILLNLHLTSRVQIPPLLFFLLHLTLETSQIYFLSLLNYVSTLVTLPFNIIYYLKQSVTLYRHNLLVQLIISIAYIIITIKSIFTS